MKPTIGRIVHYQQEQAYEVGPDTDVESLPPLPLLTRAAIVTEVKVIDGVIFPVLRVMAGPHPSSDFVVDCSPDGYKRDGVPFSDTPKMGCWNWPPRE